MDFPTLFNTTRFETVADPANSGGVLIAGNASANVKGDYTELFASTPFTATWVLIAIGGFGTEALVDIAIGAAGSESVIINNLMVSELSLRVYVAYYPLPILIPAGTRLAARCQTNPGAGSGRITVTLGGGGFLPSASYCSQITTYGADPTDTGGTQVDPGASVDTKGAYSTVAASCDEINALIVGVGGQGNTTRAIARYLLDLAIGAAGAEQVVVSNLLLRADANTDLMTPPTMFIPVHIPAGTRLSARAQCSVNDAADRLFDVILYGVR